MNFNDFNDFNDFSDQILNDFSSVVSPAVFAKKVLQMEVKPFHEEWINFMESNPYTLLLAPRGAGKSTICTVAYSVWKSLMDRQSRILIVSNTFDQSASFGREVKSYLESDNIQERFGDLESIPWSPHELRLQNHAGKESNITTLGVNGSVLGRHFSMILLDDIADEENTSTKGQRDKLLSWFQKTLIPTLNPGGSIHAIGTVFHRDDIYSFLQADPSFKTKVYDAEDYNGNLLWPERLNEEFLKNRKSQMGEVLYNLQYRNKIISDETSIFKEIYFKYYSQLPQDLDYYQAIDLASETGDYFVICTIGKAPDSGFYYIIDIDRGHYSLRQQFEHIIQKAEIYHPIKIAIETNSYQKVVSDDLKRNTALPIKPVSQFKGKITRARQLSVFFENGAILFPKKARWLKNLKEELIYFPRSKHDDVLDAMDMCVRVSQSGGKWNWAKLKETIYTGSYLQKV
jgi:predicted phage terminase large subunit-like protein